MCQNLHVGSINTYYVSSQSTEQQTFTSAENMCMQQGGIETNEKNNRAWHFEPGKHSSWNSLLLYIIQTYNTLKMKWNGKLQNTNIGFVRPVNLYLKVAIFFIVGINTDTSNSIWWRAVWNGKYTDFTQLTIASNGYSWWWHGKWTSKRESPVADLSPFEGHAMISYFINMLS